jgi:antitoxin component of MazEF toxin-antitoxin module
MSVLTSKTDRQARLILPSDFANCLVTVERVGEELRVRKTQTSKVHRYSFKELIAGVTPENIHPEIETGPAVGSEAL